ncbi:MAG: flagellar assembly peptidoglycan hydrolase FlgJ [Methylobacterium sp.]|nr:flagellar assembly peptidoglycan hydrolase FlgJ [Methylobacterium sp.]
MLGEPLALNPQGLNNLKFKASQDASDKASMRAAAQQFESYFLQLMLKSMRQTLSQDSLFDSRETRMFTEMFDQQVAQNMSQTRGVGLADMIVKQIEAAMQTGHSIKQMPRPYDLPAVGIVKPGTQPVQDGAVEEPLSPKNFVDKLWPHAVEVAGGLGVSPHLLLAQAALETGWGKAELKTADGSSSFNLFNIKAGSRWEGKTVSREVTEYVNGKSVKQTQTFRAYDSVAEAFEDYAGLLKNNPRYAGVLNQDAEGFISGLQKGGFATDPAYGDKLRRIMTGTALRDALAG